MRYAIAAADFGQVGDRLRARGSEPAIAKNGEMTLPRFRHASPNPNGHPSFGGRSVDNSLAKKPSKDWEFIFGHKADEEQIRTGNLMISQRLSAALARRNIHYGWAMVGVTFLTAVITAGTVGAPGVFIVPLQNEFGWTTAEISSALSIRFILFGLMAPFAAALLNRYGLRNVTLSALLIVASALVLSLAMTKVWQLMLLWGVVVGLGTGMTALVLGATIAARWFAQRRGLVVGILTASVATGQLVFLPLLASLTERMGWRIALALVCGMLGVAAFAVVVGVRGSPSA